MRATTLLNRVLCLPKTTVRDVEFGDEVTVWVRPQQRVMSCPHCDFRTRHRYDTRVVDSTWRHLDLGGRVCVLKLRRRRLRCPEHGVLAESVPFARPGSGFTRDFEELVVWLATKCDKKTVSVFCRVAWRTVGTMCARIVAERLDDDHLSNLVDIGVDEISWRKHHKYLTLVSDHETAKIVWGAPGKKAATLDRFFTDALPEGGPHKIEAVSMDLGPAFAKSVWTHAPQAVLCFDPFYVDIDITGSTWSREPTRWLMRCAAAPPKRTGCGVAAKAIRSGSTGADCCARPNGSPTSSATNCSTSSPRRIPTATSPPPGSPKSC